MALFKVTNDRLEAVRTTSFIEEKLLERKDLQRLLRVDISPIGADLMVIAEEFGDWGHRQRSIRELQKPDRRCSSDGAGIACVAGRALMVLRTPRRRDCTRDQTQPE